MQNASRSQIVRVGADVDGVDDGVDYSIQLIDSEHLAVCNVSWRFSRASVVAVAITSSSVVYQRESVGFEENSGDRIV